MELDLSFRAYEGSTLLQIQEIKGTPLVQDFLFENDFVMLVAKDKAGKSVLGLQLACCLSSGTEFLGLLEVPNPVKVWYFAMEGKDYETQMRLMLIS